jgi:hypothetical protein
VVSGACEAREGERPREPPVARGVRVLGVRFQVSGFGRREGAKGDNDRGNFIRRLRR